jgi:hypothetical protein
MRSYSATITVILTKPLAPFRMTAHLEEPAPLSSA